MDRTAYNALLAQYATPEVSGDGRVSWDGGVKCVIPSVNLYGKCEQKTLTGKNLWTTDAQYPIRSGGINRVLYDAETQTYEMPEGDNMSVSRSIYTLPEPIPAGTTITIAAFFDSGRMTGTISFGGYHRGDAKSWQGAINIAANTALAGEKYTKTFVTTDTVTDFWVFLYGDAVVTETIRIRMMYVIGDSVGDWEPYTAGMPMPSPALPSPVKCNNGTFRSISADGTYDGGIAQAPELLAIPGTAYRDEWDAQTGRGVRRCGVIDSYAGETISTPYISSTGGLTDGATVVYGIPDAPFATAPVRLTMPTGPGQIIQTGGDVADCPITARYLTHS